MEAISAIESMTKNMKKQTIRNTQTAPAGPPFANPNAPVLFQQLVRPFQLASFTRRGTDIRANSQVDPIITAYPKMEKNLKLRYSRQLAIVFYHQRRVMSMSSVNQRTLNSCILLSHGFDPPSSAPPGSSNPLPQTPQLQSPKF